MHWMPPIGQILLFNKLRSQWFVSKLNKHVCFTDNGIGNGRQLSDRLRIIQTQKDSLATSAISNCGISISAIPSKKILDFFIVLIEISDKEIKIQIAEQGRWLIQLSGKEQFTCFILYQNTSVKIWLMDKELLLLGFFSRIWWLYNSGRVKDEERIRLIQHNLSPRVLDKTGWKRICHCKKQITCRNFKQSVEKHTKQSLSQVSKFFPSDVGKMMSNGWCLPTSITAGSAVSS